jgi:hypothetical protein
MGLPQGLPQGLEMELRDSARFEIDSRTRPFVVMICVIRELDWQTRGISCRRRRRREEALSRSAFAIEGVPPRAADAGVVASRRWGSDLKLSFVSPRPPPLCLLWLASIKTMYSSSGLVSLSGFWLELVKELEG